MQIQSTMNTQMERDSYTPKTRQDDNHLIEKKKETTTTKEQNKGSRCGARTMVDVGQCFNELQWRHDRIGATKRPIRRDAFQTFIVIFAM